MCERIWRKSLSKFKTIVCTTWRQHFVVVVVFFVLLLLFWMWNCSKDTLIIIRQNDVIHDLTKYLFQCSYDTIHTHAHNWRCMQKTQWDEKKSNESRAIELAHTVPWNCERGGKGMKKMYIQNCGIKSKTEIKWCGIYDVNEIDGRKIEAKRNKVGQYNSPKDLKDSIRMFLHTEKIPFKISRAILRTLIVRMHS